MKQDNDQQSTPTTSGVNISDYVEAIEKQKYELNDSDDFPPTQAFQYIRPKGEVFYNLDASPSVREALRKKLEESSPDIPRSESPLRPPSPKLKLRGSQRRKPSETDLKEGLEFKVFVNQLCINVDKSEEKTPSPPKNNLFDSDDDSFLMQCTQAVEEKRPSPIVRAKKEETPAAKTNNDTFDDGLDSILSQMEIPESFPTSSAVSMKSLHQPLQQPQKLFSSVVTDPAIIPNNALKPSKSPVAFKRFKSADNIKGSSGRFRNSSGSIMKSWQRSKSSPEHGKKKCTKEEIEMKKLAALRRRNEKK